MGDNSAVHWVLDGLFTIVLATVGWIMKGFRDDHKELEGKHDALAAALPETYARRDDVQQAMARVEALFGRIDAKLDQKADKH